MCVLHMANVCVCVYKMDFLIGFDVNRGSNVVKNTIKFKYSKISEVVFTFRFFLLTNARSMVQRQNEAHCVLIFNRIFYDFHIFRYALLC